MRSRRLYRRLGLCDMVLMIVEARGWKCVLADLGVTSLQVLVL